MSAHIITAQRELNEFMKAHQASAEEIDRVVGMRPGTVQLVLDGEPPAKANMFAERIVADMVCEETLIAKLNELRGITTEEKKPETVKQKSVAAKEEQKQVDDSGEAKQQQAERIEAAILAAKKRLNTSIVGLCRALKKGKSYLNNAQAQALNGLQKPEKTDEIVASLENLTEADLIPSNRTGATKHASQKDDISDPVKSESSSKSDTSEPTEDRSQVDAATCIGCGCTDAKACEGGCSWLEVDREEKLGVCSNCPEMRERWYLGWYLVDEAEDEEQLSLEDSQAEAFAYGPGMEEIRDLLHKLLDKNIIATPIHPDMIKAAGRDLVEESLGISFDELKSLKPQIEMLMVCKRNNIDCEVVPDSVRFS